MRVSADLDLCQGHQMCQLEAPDVFGFDDEADQVVVLQEHPTSRLRHEVARPCPTARRWRSPSTPTPRTEEQDR